MIFLTFCVGLKITLYKQIFSGFTVVFLMLFLFEKINFSKTQIFTFRRKMIIKKKV